MRATELYNPKYYPGMTVADAERINRLNAKRGWGITNSSLMRLIRQHKKARSNEDARTMSVIEYRLTDINFHSECRLIHAGKYKEAIQLSSIY